jgi:HAD-superfamily hydrolase, subfamily IIB
MSIKLVAIDMDGTFLDSKCTVPKENMEAIKKAIDKGIKIVPTTGRCYRNTKEMIFTDVNEIPYYITANGAVLVDGIKEEEIFAKLMPAMTVREVYEITKKYPTFVEIYAGLDVYIDELGEQRLYQSGVPKEYAKQLTKTTIKVKSLDDIIYDDNILVSKYHVLTETVEENIKMRDEIAAIKGLNPISVVPQNVELVDGTWSKKDAIVKLIEMLKIDKEEVLVIGDSNNDYEMMQWATNAVAMGNANEKIKALASHVTATNDEAGVAQALHKYLDI